MFKIIEKLSKRQGMISNDNCASVEAMTKLTAVDCQC